MWWWRLFRLSGASRLVPIAYRAARRRDGWPGRESVLRSWRGRGPFAGWQDGFLEAYVEHGLRSRAGGGVELCCSPAWESRCFATCDHRVWSFLPQVQCPVLVIYGRESDTFCRRR